MPFASNTMPEHVLYSLLWGCSTSV